MSNINPKAFFISCLVITTATYRKEKTIPVRLTKSNEMAPETQSGARRLGLLVDTIDQDVFAGAGPFSQPPQATAIYEPVYGYGALLVISWRQTTMDVVATITIRTDRLSISQGQVISLANASSGKASASYEVENYTGGNDLYKTVANKPGKLYISRLDQTNHIISGTFFFDAVNAKGDTVHITDGRFDLQYQPY